MVHTVDAVIEPVAEGPAAPYDLTVVGKEPAQPLEVLPGDLLPAPSLTQNGDKLSKFVLWEAYLKGHGVNIYAQECGCGLGGSNLPKTDMETESADDGQEEWLTMQKSSR